MGDNGGAASIPLTIRIPMQSAVKMQGVLIYKTGGMLNLLEIFILKNFGMRCFHPIGTMLYPNGLCMFGCHGFSVWAVDACGAVRTKGKAIAP